MSTRTDFLEEKIREILDVSAGWGYTLPDAERLELIISIGNQALQRTGPAGEWFDDRSRVEREIAGALKNAIDAHGSVRAVNRSSAAKRVYGQLKALRREMKNSD